MIKHFDEKSTFLEIDTVQFPGPVFAGISTFESSSSLFRHKKDAEF